MTPNRIVAFFGPYVAIGSGIVADWLTVHVHLLSTFHIDKATTTGWITQALVFGVSAIVVYAGQHHWLTGWQQFENRVNAGVEDVPVGAADQVDA